MTWRDLSKDIRYCGGYIETRQRGEQGWYPVYIVIDYIAPPGYPYLGVFSKRVEYFGRHGPGLLEVVTPHSNPAIIFDTSKYGLEARENGLVLVRGSSQNPGFAIITPRVPCT